MTNELFPECSGDFLMNKLPIEIQDKIFLLLDYESLEKCRPLQSEYVKRKTQCVLYSEAIKNENLENLKWLKSEEFTSQNKCNSYKNEELFQEYDSAKLNIKSEYSNEHTSLIRNLIWMYNNTKTEYKGNVYWFCTVPNAVKYASINSLLLIKAIQSKNVNIVQWAIENFYITNKNQIFSVIAILEGNLDILKCILDLGLFLCSSESAFKTCAKVGNLEIAKWLREKHFQKNKLNTKVIEISIENNDFKFMEWYVEQEGKLSSDVFSYTVKLEKLDILKWIQIKGCEINFNSFVHLNKYILEHKLLRGL